MFNKLHKLLYHQLRLARSPSPTCNTPPSISLDHSLNTHGRYINRFCRNYTVPVTRRNKKTIHVHVNMSSGNCLLTQTQDLSHSSQTVLQIVFIMQVLSVCSSALRWFHIGLHTYCYYKVKDLQKLLWR